MKKLLVIFFLLFSPFQNLFANEFKSKWGMSYELDKNYILFNDYTYNELREFVKNNQDPIKQKLLDFMDKKFEKRVFETVEFLINPYDYTTDETINIIKTPASKTMINAKITNDLVNLKCIDMKQKKEQMFQTSIKTYECKLVNIPKSAKWSYYREEDTLVFGEEPRWGRTLQYNFITNINTGVYRNITITGICYPNNCNKMRKDLIKMVSSIK